MATKTYNIPSMAAAAAQGLDVPPSTFVRCMTGNAAFTIRLRTASEQIAEVADFGAGLAISSPVPFTTIEIVNGSTQQTLSFVVSDGTIEDNRLVGTVNITGGLNAKPIAADAATCAAVSVTTASVQILAANTNRARAVIENTGAYNIAVGVAAAVTYANGMLIIAVPAGSVAGGVFEVKHKGAIWGIASGGTSEVRAHEETYT